MRWFAPSGWRRSRLLAVGGPEHRELEQRRGAGGLVAGGSGLQVAAGEDGEFVRDGETWSSWLPSNLLRTFDREAALMRPRGLRPRRY